MDIKCKYDRRRLIMGIHQYFKRLSDLEKLIRLPGKFKYFEHNVAAHSFKVTKLLSI